MQAPDAQSSQCTIRSQLQHLCKPKYGRQHWVTQFCHYIIGGSTRGFQIGFNPACSLKSTRHMPSTEKQVSVIEDCLAKERAAGHLIRPLIALPKGHYSRKWRLITNLSHPPGCSVNDGVNDGVNPQYCSLSHVVDTVASIIASFGPGSPMTIVDIESAYWLILVNPDERSLLAVR